MQEEADAEAAKRRRIIASDDDDSRDALPDPNKAKEDAKEPEKPKELPPVAPLPTYAELSGKVLEECSDSIRPFFEKIFHDDYDVRKHTSFYCTPCNELMTSTAQWEDHYGTDYHHKMTQRWRLSTDIRKASVDGEKSTAKAQAEVNASTELLVGSEEAVEVSNEEGKTKNWVCTLCTIAFPESELLVLHLASVAHIDRYLERLKPETVQPPRKADETEDNMAVVESNEAEKKVRENGTMTMSGLGKGRLRTYRGPDFQDWPEETDGDAAEKEVAAVKAEMAKVFNEDGTIPADFDVPFVKVDDVKKMSVANCDYEEQPSSDGSVVMGLQWLVELWAPSRRAVPLFYCILCGSVTRSWEAHCSLLKHASLYIMQQYKAILETLLKEATGEEAFKVLFNTARQKILFAEGRMGRIGWVIQQKSSPNRIFVAFNDRIARKLAVEARVEVGPPPKRPKSKKTIKKPAAERDIPKQDFSNFGKTYDRRSPPRTDSGAPPPVPVPAANPQDIQRFKPQFGNRGIYSEFKGSSHAGVDFSSLNASSEPVVIPQGPVGMPENFAQATAAIPANPSQPLNSAAPGPPRTAFNMLSKEDLGKVNASLSKAGVAEFVSNEHDLENLRRTLGENALESFIANARKT